LCKFHPPIKTVIFYLQQKNTVRKAIEDVFKRIDNEFRAASFTNTKFTSDNVEQIEKLAGLLEKGLITEQEFNKKKKELLAS
jgi:hypothetical protein